MKKERKSLWKGIKAVITAVIDWVATLFGMKDNSKYGRVLRRVVGTAFAAAVIFWAMTALERFGRCVYLYGIAIFDSDNENVYFSERLSDDISYYDGYYGHYGYLKNAQGKKVLKHILCINKPMEGDSLVYFSDGDKRGYFHMRDGHLVVKPIYEHAWIFSDGLAAVEVDGRVKFIDTAGNVVIDKGFAYDASDDGYVFHQGHCAVNDKDGKHMGLIDRNGDWVLPPVYRNIYPVDTFWLVRNDDEQAIITFSMDTLFPLSKAKLEIGDTAIFVTFADHTQSLYNLQGELMTANMIRDVEQLVYETPEVVYPAGYSGHDDDNDLAEYYGSEPYTRQAVATCLCYEAECGWYGLLSPEGKLLSSPSYRGIEAIGKDLYLCKTSYGYGVLLNSKGQRVK